MVSFRLLALALQRASGARTSVIVSREQSWLSSPGAAVGLRTYAQMSTRVPRGQSRKSGTMLRKLTSFPPSSKHVSLAACDSSVKKVNAIGLNANSCRYRESCRCDFARVALRLDLRRAGRARSGNPSRWSWRRYSGGAKKPVTVPESVNVPSGDVNVFSASGMSHVTVGCGAYGFAAAS